MACLMQNRRDIDIFQKIIFHLERVTSALKVYKTARRYKVVEKYF